VSISRAFLMGTASTAATLFRPARTRHQQLVARQPKEQTRYDTAVSQLLELIRQAKASQSSFAASAASREDALEWQRQRLLRHLTR